MKLVCVLVDVVVVADSFFFGVYFLYHDDGADDEVIFLSNETVAACRLYLGPLPSLRNRCCSGGLTRSLYKTSINQKQSSARLLEFHTPG